MSFAESILAFAALTLFCAGTACAQATDADRAKAFEIYQNIVSIRSAEGQGKVPELARYLASEFTNASFPEQDVEVRPMGDTAALVVRYRGDDSSGKAPILFLAHMDVVDARPEDWELDPFTVTEKDGYYFGRGTADNKYGVMNLTQSFIRLKKEGFTPNRDLIIAFSGDEETTMETTRALAADPELSSAEFALNSDAGGGAVTPEGVVLPYYMQTSEKTYATFILTARNPGGHSSRPRPDNAIYDLARALLEVEAYEFPVMSNETTLASARAEGKQLGGKMGEALIAFAQDPTDESAIATLRASEVYSNILSTTCVATMLEAGHAENALPQTARATINCRIFPGVEIEDVRQTLETVVGNEALELKPGDDTYVASPASEPREDVTAALRAALSTRYPDIVIIPSMSSGGTDGMHFRRAGVPTYGASAGFTVLGESANAHGLDERVNVEFFYAGLDHWPVLIRNIAGEP
jgi:acetylornithine deacetylase/succinyl-diaminopimelate desuccinylase-like protein